jgi:hypothetical protein
LEAFRSDGWGLFNASYPPTGILGGSAAYKRAIGAVDAMAAAQARVEASRNKVFARRPNLCEGRARRPTPPFSPDSDQAFCTS